MRSNEPRPAARRRSRALAFEQLETKAALSALFLSCDPSTPAAAETAPQTALAADQAAVSRSQWPLCSEDLLQFIEEHTVADRAEPWTSPNLEECARAEQMLIGQEFDLRSLAIAHTLELN